MSWSSSNFRASDWDKSNWTNAAITLAPGEMLAGLYGASSILAQALAKGNFAASLVGSTLPFFGLNARAALGSSLSGSSVISSISKGLGYLNSNLLGTASLAGILDIPGATEILANLAGGGELFGALSGALYLTADLGGHGYFIIGGSIEESLLLGNLIVYRVTEKEASIVTIGSLADVQRYVFARIDVETQDAKLKQTAYRMRFLPVTNKASINNSRASVRTIKVVRG